MIVLSSGHLNYRDPTFEEISFQVYSALAYGAKSIGYYLYSKSGKHAGYTSWILEDYVDNSNVVDSLHGPLYSKVKMLNADIQSMGMILLNLKSIEVIHSSDYPNNQKNIAETIFKPNVSNGIVKNIINKYNNNKPLEILIGIYTDNKINPGIKYLLIVNKDVLYSSEIELVFNKTYNIYLFNKKESKFTKLSMDQNVKLGINAGSGELLRLKE